ncbi:MAG: protein-L-isoaspartate O-methyltransferase [Proteobacteria bacterium]|nr:protein-L-isoaspartate O-methyltransferase [Pseudomonadota bacterium]TDJ36141.1 MAG: protein-L-isoaspartate O-methyltransferase [Gammaproteobacteria bacterium]
MKIDLVRRQMVKQQVRVWNVSNQEVLNVLDSVAREQFVPAGCEDVAYADTEIPLAHGQVMLRPIIEGRVLQALAPGTGDTVLEIGTGTGYLTACLARMSASVTSIDIHEDFIATASRNLETAEIENASVQCMDAMAELPEGDFDAIAVTGSVRRIDERFVNALKPGGRLFLVVGESPIMSALLISRNGDDLHQSVLFETDIPALENIAEESVFFF